MRLGIYTRETNLLLPTIMWMHSNGFDSFNIYKDKIPDEFEDVSEREGLNKLLYDLELNKLDGIYVEDLKIISAVTVKILQVLLLFQKMNTPLFYNNGCIDPDDKMIKKIHDQINEEWLKIQKESKKIDLFDQNFNQL